MEDDEGLNQLLCRRLSEAGLTAFGAHSGAEAARILSTRPLDLLLLDYLLPDTDARKFITNLNGSNRLVPFVIMTGHGDEDVVVEMMRLGARDYVTKQVNFVDLLLEVVQRVLRDLEVERALAAAEDSLRLSEEKYRFLFNAAPVGICTCRLDGTVIDANPALVRITGHSLDELRSTPFLGVCAEPDIRNRLLALTHSSGKPVSEECELHRPDGSVVPVLLNALVVEQAGETVVFLTLLDISQRRRAEAALRQSEQRLLEAQVLGRIGHWSFDIATRRMEWSDTTFTLFERDKSLGPPTLEEETSLYSPEQAALLRSHARRAIRDGQVHDCDLVTSLPGGRVAFFHVVMKPVNDSSGRVVRLVGTVQDITARKRAELAVELERDQMRRILDTLPDLIYIVNCNWDIEYVNPALIRLNGEPAGRKCYEWFHNLNAPCPDCRAAEVFAGRVVRDDYTTTTGRTYDILDIPVQDPDGSFSKLGVLRDITERRRVEQELERYRRHLEDLVAGRTSELRAAQEALLRQTRLATLGQLAGSVAHEIRNPLSSIRNAAWFLRNYAADKLQGRPLRHVALIEEEIERANEVISSLLDFARGREMQPAHWQLGALLDAAVREAGLPKSIRVVRNIPTRLPEVFVDRSSLITVLANLLSNAAQAMDGAGSVCVTAKHSAAAVRISVSDAGPGIRPDDMPRVFEPLFSTRPLGIGLGLAIARSFVEANRGTINIESQPGKGTSVILTLPVSPPPAQPAASAGGSQV
ncbi:MAG: PAS domain S-box protein [candidate division WOR-3 bacterium]